MHIESLRDYCLLKNGVTEGFPFGEEVLVFRVLGKIFLLVPVSSRPLQFNAKCDPERAVELRERYDCVQPGYHMNKTHWNTIIADGSVSDALLKEWIDHSYDLIAASLPKNLRGQLDGTAAPAVKKTAPGKSSAAKKSAVKKSPAKKTAVKKASPKKSPPKKAAAKTSPAKKSSAKKPAAKKTATKKSPPKKAVKQSSAKKPRR